MRFFAYAFMLVCMTAGVSYLQTKKPEAIEQLIVKVDVFGLSDAASSERQRLAQIRALDIPFEQKKVLMERNIFMGASRDMVFLALGNPNEAKKTEGGERWVYYFQDQQRPTVLEFKGSTLVSAFKGSKLDV
jgi:hypothetical protein